MSNVILFNPSDNAFITFDWSDICVNGLTLTSVVHAVPAPLTKVSESTASPQSQVKVQNGVHGSLYQIAGAATLSNGENINRVFPVRYVNS
jgi:hypothetical protein